MLDRTRRDLCELSWEVMTIERVCCFEKNIETLLPLRNHSHSQEASYNLDGVYWCFLSPEKSLICFAPQTLFCFTWFLGYDGGGRRGRGRENGYAMLYVHWEKAVDVFFLSQWLCQLQMNFSIIRNMTTSYELNTFSIIGYPISIKYHLSGQNHALIVRNWSSLQALSCLVTWPEGGDNWSTPWYGVLPFYRVPFLR